MNREKLQRSWTQLRGRLRMQWGRLIDDHLCMIEGRRDILLGRLQKAYGLSAQEAERRVTAWEDAQGPRGDVPPQRAPRAI